MKGLFIEAEWSPREGYKISDFEKESKKAITGSSVWKNSRLVIKEVKEPKPGDDEVLIKVKACGICGSDVHFYEKDKEGYILYPGLTKFPCIIGHEFSGEIVERGKNVKSLKVGDKVTAEEMIWCGHCNPCRNGYPNQCENLEEIGFTIDGGIAEYICIGAKYCWKIDEISGKDEREIYSKGATVEPTSVAYNGIFVRGEGFKPGAYVGVYGCGPIGLAAIALCRAAGASKIIAFEVTEKRQQLAKELGADYIFNPLEVDVVSTILEITDGYGCDMQVESAGAPAKTLINAEKVIAIGGKIVQIGRASERVPLYLENLQVRAGQIYGAQGHSGYATFQNVIRLIAQEVIDTSKIITSYFTLENSIDAIKKASARDEGKVMIIP